MQQVLGELWLQELIYQKWAKMGESSGRSAWHLNIPCHVFGTGAKWHVYKASKPWIARWFDQKDWKAWAMEGWVHIQCPNSVSRPKPTWARMWNHWLMRRWNGGPRWAKPRPASLSITCFGPNPFPPTSSSQSKPSTKSRWPDGEIHRLAA